MERKDSNRQNSLIKQSASLPLTVNTFSVQVQSIAAHVRLHCGGRRPDSTRPPREAQGRQPPAHNSQPRRLHLVLDQGPARSRSAQGQ
ncbi:hypothetical protein AVEN_20021-1 [Araneus ventricosus]|uniref:Uncharacterized protein n=1 Tax=Araneus ventricosus TaxID=182803 RepID=A0A4Y2J8C0_ARAVE|nr:hypothetical protein AVEN_20021-1 [Araneus ventricosus]